MLGRHEVRREQRGVWIEEGPGRPEDDQDGQDRPGLLHLPENEDEQRGGAERLGEHAYAHDRPPPEAVGHGAGDENEEQRGEELRQADEAQMQRIPGEIVDPPRSEEHTSELQSLMRISYAVFCLKKKTQKEQNTKRT